MPTDAEFYRHLNHYEDDTVCAMCRDEQADPDCPDGYCGYCCGEEGEEDE